MKITSLKNAKKNAVQMDGAAGAFKQVPIPAAEVPNFVFRVFTLEPGGYTPKHCHPYEHVNYIISGRGTLFSEEKGEQELRAGDFALVLPNELHQYRNASPDEPFVMICAVPREFE